MKAILAAFLMGSVMVTATPLAAWAAPPAAIDGVVLPDTGPGHAAAQWLSAFNAEDYAAITVFETRYQRPVTDPAMLRGFRGITGGFTLIRVEKSDANSIEALLLGKTDEAYSRINIAMDSATPPKIVGLDISLTPTPFDLVPARLADSALVTALDERIAKAEAKDTFSGVVLLAKNGQPIYEKAIGEADRTTHARITMDTQFRIGSMNKMFTSVAVLQLVDAGKIGLDDPIGKYLTDYPNAETAKVTVRQLLTHTGGTVDIFTPEYQAQRLNVRTIDDYIALFGNRPPQFTPGKDFAYSNYGFILLGALIEKVTGRDYYSHVEEAVFRPAGMTHTASLPEEVSVPDRATGYMRSPQGWISAADTLPWRGTSAGGGYSTAGDLLKFAQALQSGKLLKPETLARATGGRVRGADDDNYGFGFAADNGGPFDFYGHGGGAPGINGDLRIYPRAGYVVISLSNLDPPSAQSISHFAGQRIGGK